MFNRSLVLLAGSLLSTALMATGAGAVVVDLAAPPAPAPLSISAEPRDLQIESIATSAGDAVPELFLDYGAFGSSTMQIQTSNLYGYYFFAGPIGVYQRTTQNISTSHTPGDLDLGDINSDGSTDIVIATLGGTNYVRSAGNGVYNAVQSPSGDTFAAQYGVELARIDANLTADVVTISNDDLAIFYNTGNLTTPYSTRTPVASISGARGLAVADFDGDGVLDAATTTPGDQRVVVFTSGVSTPMSVQTSIGLYTRPGAITAADVSGDSRPEIIVTEPDRGTVAVISTGSLTELVKVLGPVTRIPTGYSPVDVDTADFDQNGTKEIVVANAGSDSVTIAEVGGGVKSFPAGPTPAQIAVGKMNDDSRPDLLVENDSIKAVTPLVNLGVPAPPLLPIVPVKRTASLKCTAAKKSRGKVRSVTCKATLSDKSAAKSLAATLLRGKAKVKSAKASPGKSLIFKVPAGLRAGSYSVKLTVANTDGTSISASRSLKIK